MFRTLVLGAALFVGAPALACPMADAAAYRAAVEEVEAADGTKVALAVEGMHCGDCSEKVVTALKGLDGVIAAAVDYQTGVARVVIDADKVDSDKMVAAIGELGFTAKVDTAS